MSDEEYQESRLRNALANNWPKIRRVVTPLKFLGVTPGHKGEIFHFTANIFWKERKCSVTRLWHPYNSLRTGNAWCEFRYELFQEEKDAEHHADLCGLAVQVLERVKIDRITLEASLEKTKREMVYRGFHHIDRLVVRLGNPDNIGLAVEQLILSQSFEYLVTERQADLFCSFLRGKKIKN
jgi:hypothetical protein